MRINDIEFVLTEQLGDVARLSNSGGNLIEIKAAFCNDQRYSDDAFIVIPVYTGFKGQRQTVKLNGGKIDQTVGYIFPVSALDTQEVFEEDEKYQKIFANAAVRQSIGLGRSDNIQNEIAIDTFTQVEFSELYNDNFCICVLGRWNLKNAGLSERMLKLLLFGVGVIVPTDSRRFREGKHKEIEWRPTFKLPSVTDSIDDELLSSIERIIQEADTSDYLVGAFITYFQIIEIYIDRIFSDLISGLPKSMDAWELKEKLHSITNSKKRINILFHECGGGVHSDVKREFSHACIDLLKAVRKEDPGEDFSANLYEIRNLIVHKQVSVLVTQEERISVLNCALREFLISLVVHYIPVNAQKFWGVADAGEQFGQARQSEKEHINATLAKEGAIYKVRMAILNLIRLFSIRRDRKTDGAMSGR
jgi:hypothetical protein